MSVRISQPLKICLSSLLAALLIGLQNIDEYAQQLERRFPELMETAEALRFACRYTGLPQWFALQRKLYSFSDNAAEELAPYPFADAEGFEPTEVGDKLDPAPEVQPVPAAPVVKKAEKKKTGKKIARKRTNKKKPRRRRTQRKQGVEEVRTPAATEQVSPTKEEVVEPVIETPQVRKKIKLIRRQKPRRRFARRRTRLSYPFKLKGQKRRKVTLTKRKGIKRPALRVLAPQPAPQPEPQPAPQPEPQPETKEAEINLSAKEIREANEAQPVHYRIMLMGDSMMQSLAPQTHRAFSKRKGLHFIFSARFSTGLSDSNYFDWPESMRRTMELKRPNLVVVFIGANDGVSIVEGRKVYHIGNKGWKEAYACKMKQLGDIAAQFGCKLIWVGLPPMGPRYRAMQSVIAAQRDFCRENGITYLNTNPIMGTPKGEFTAYATNARGKTVRIRMKDQCHLTDEGNALLLEHLSPMIEQHIYRFRQNNPRRCLTPDELNRIKNATRETSINPMRSTNKEK